MSSVPAPSVIRWPVFVLLAIPAIAAALAITFAADHSVRFGLIVLGAFGLGTAVAGLITVRFLPERGLRIRAVIRATVAGLLGIVSLTALGWAGGPGVESAVAASELSWIIAVGLAAIAIVDASTWLRLRGRDRAARDWLASAVLHLVGAVAPLLVPANFLMPYVVRDRDVVLPLELTASIIIVGVTGAVLAVLGVYLAIAGLSLLPSRRGATEASGAVTLGGTSDKAVNA